MASSSYLKEVKAAIREVLIYTPSRGFTVSEFLSNYKRLTKSKILIRTLGFYDINSFLRSIPDTIRCEGPKDNITVYPAAGILNQKVGERLNSRKKSSEPKKPDKDKAKGILKIAPPGYLPNPPAPAPIRPTFPVRNINMSDLAEDESSFPTVIIPPSPKQRQPAKEKPKSPPPDPNPEPEDDLLLIEVPQGAQGFGDFIPSATFHSEVLEKGTFIVSICEVHNPNRFWFHFENELDTLQKLMNDLKIVYGNLLEEDWAISPKMMIRDLVVAASFMDTWHRGVIVQEPKNSLVGIFFLDYGTTIRIPVVKVKFLHKHFAKLPRFAHRGSLADVIPADSGYWSLSGSFNFLEEVKGNKLLWATCLKVRKPENIYNLQLLDTNRPEDFNLSKALIDSGAALLRDKNWPWPHRLHIAEIYPEFEALETGAFYRLKVVREMHDSGLTMEEIYRPPWMLDKALGRVKKQDSTKEAKNKVEKPPRTLPMKKKESDTTKFMRHAYKTARRMKTVIDLEPKKRYSNAILIWDKLNKQLENSD